MGAGPGGGGLNPHSGEGGLFGGRGDERFVVPAAAAARAAGLRAATDAYVCRYHDQGHIPLEALAFDEAINVTLGPPVVRTSVSHGAAFAIAWKGVASPTNLFEAVRLAARLAGGPVVILAIADDLSGAAECAAVARHHGLTVVVRTGPWRPAADDVVVLDTDSRSLPPAAVWAAGL